MVIAVTIVNNACPDGVAPLLGTLVGSKKVQDLLVAMMDSAEVASVTTTNVSLKNLQKRTAATNVTPIATVSLDIARKIATCSSSVSTIASARKISTRAPIMVGN